MYAQIFFVTSVRGAVFTPQTLANASLSFFGAKMPTPFFFMAAAIFLPFAFAAVLPRAFFVALSVAFVAFDIQLCGPLCEEPATRLCKLPPASLSEMKNNCSRGLR